MARAPQYSQRRDYYSRKLEDIFKELETDPNQGLKIKERDARLEWIGFNEIPKAGKSIVKIYLAPIFNIFIIILIASAIILLTLGERGNALITFIVIGANSITAIVQQYRAHKTLESLQKIAIAKAIILRKGKTHEIDMKNLVPGEIVLLSPGDKIPADGRIIESFNLTVNEAPLTGESVPVEKGPGVIVGSKVPIQKQSNMVFMGTYVTTGRAKIVVTATGIFSEIGKISKSLAETGTPDIPLTRKMNNFARFLAIIVIMLLITIFWYKVYWYVVFNPLTPLMIGIFGIRAQFVDSIAIAMNTVPINLPLLTTVILVTGVFNLAKSGVIIRNISAVEAMGRVSVVCSDKTGTITQNQMTVQKIWFNNRIFNVTGAGYDINGQILENGSVIELKSYPYLHLMLISGILNNNASITEERVLVKLQHQSSKIVRNAVGDPTEAALIVLAEKAGLDPIGTKYEYEILQEFSFNSDLKRMTTIYKDPKGNITAYIKGATEIILDLSSSIVLSNKIVPLTEEMKNEIKTQILNHAEQGYRTLAIGVRDLDKPLQESKPVKPAKAKKKKKQHKWKREDVEEDIVFLGFVMILDPPREGVREAVQSCESAGITVVMITGDHPSTAKAIAQQMNIYEPGELVVEGKDIHSLSTEDFLKTAVFSRVLPSDKEVIVKRYQNEADRIVAMTGDGINDALALKNSDTGIAMGIMGTDVAKESADMVISDDNFASIEKGIRVGRGIYSRIRMIIFFFICIDLVEGAVFFTLAFIPGVVSYTFVQHTFLVLAVHSLPPLILAFDSFPKDIMKEPPRNNEELFNRNTFVLLCVSVAFMALGYLLAFLLPFSILQPDPFINLNPYLTSLDPVLLTKSWPPPLHLQKARTMCMNVIFISECAMIWSIRRPNSSLFKSIREEFNVWLMVIIGIVLYGQIGLTIFGGLNTLGNWSMTGGSIVSGQSLISLLASLTDGFLDLYWMFLNPIDWLVVLVLAFQSIAGIELFKWWARRKGWFF
ncbi:MAG: cation-translocating P-type ATPase [Candidatus Helarchaeota archaeon]